MNTLGSRGVVAVKWTVAATAVRVVLQLGGQVVLARRLGPDVYGLFGIGMLVFTFSNFLATFGFGWALLQAKEVTDEDLRFAFTWQFVAGVTAMGAVILLAPGLAGFFHEPRAEAVIRWLSVACLLNAVAAPSVHLLMRDLDFRATGLIDAGSYAVGYLLVGLTLAWRGAGVGALVAAWLVQSLVKLVASYWLRPHPLRPLLWFPGARPLLATGSTVLATNLANWGLGNVDRVMVGRLLDAQAVGLFGLGSNLAATPTNLLISAQPAFFSAAARLQDDRTALQRAFRQVLGAVWILVTPAFVLLALIAPDLVRGLYGDRWAGAGRVLAALALAMPAYLTWAMATPVLWNTGRKHLEAALQLPLIGLAVAGFLVAGGRGIAQAGMVAAALYVARGAVMFAAAIRSVGLPVAELVPSVLRAAATTTIAVAGWAVAGQCWPEAPALASALGGAAVGFAVLAGAALSLPGLIGPDAGLVIGRFVPRLQSRLQGPVGAPAGMGRHHG